MKINLQGMDFEKVQGVLQAAQSASFRGATAFGNGAIIIDEFDNVIFDDVYKNFPIWARLDKRLAPGETTGGIDQTAVATGRAANPRALSFSSTGPTRAERTRRTITAIVANTTFGMFERSVYAQQGRRFGDLQAKDVQDLKTACMRKWNAELYTGDSSGSSYQYDGLRKILGSGSTISATTSIFKGIEEAIVAAVNGTTAGVQFTAIYTNALVVYMLGLELYKAGGHKLEHTTFNVGNTPFNVPVFPSSVGNLPLVADPYNTVVAGTPVTYPTFVVNEQNIRWEYVEPLGNPGPDPSVFQIAMTNALDLETVGVMFGALDMLGTTTHAIRLNVENRTTVVDPSA